METIIFIFYSELKVKRGLKIMSKLYKLSLQMYWAEEDEKARIRIPKLKELLHEILGYTKNEINIMEERYFSNDIAKNLTGEQVLKIAQPFKDWNVTPSLRDNATNEFIGYNPAQLYLQPPSPKDHYCDEPMVGREYLVDPVEFYRQEDEKRRAYITAQNFRNTHPTVTCPYCHSTNTSKISTTSKVINTALFGIFGNKRKHQWHCNGCGSDF